MKVPHLLLVWMNFGPTHLDRLEAVREALAGRYIVRGLELFGKSQTYSWTQVAKAEAGVETLLPGADENSGCWFDVTRALVSVYSSMNRGSIVAVCHYERPEIFLSSCFARLRGCRMVLMNDSKFSDYQRHWTRELIKVLLHLPYQGGVAGSQDTKDYMAFLGINPSRIHIGYDVVSGRRLRALAGKQRSFSDRQHFIVVARLVPKKNYVLLLRSYVVYAKSVERPLPLKILGDGPEESSVRSFLAENGISGLVSLGGFVQSDRVAEEIASARALLLLSTEEQFGLAVAEAVLLETPVIVSDCVGARASLVRQGVNGVVVETDNIRGVAEALRELTESESQWTTMSKSCVEFHDKADVSAFVTAIKEFLDN